MNIQEQENSGYLLGSGCLWYAIVFQAEILAIVMVAQREDIASCVEEKIFTSSDSQAALRAISSPRTRPILVQKGRDALNSLAKQKEIWLVWVSEHMGISGNKGTD
ncbi:hypothetical protein NQ315_010066 [Exocentrus adspersus]|uniref:RNase H type-1 domain-containing protein n=1 Tax=Exocentrus adspersus TaxID=1586481 RepID=A0AAV8WAA5_9CUCU|nr:hypothetical protein NQ315_010066 [Exocentrus adspersus]